MIGMKRRFRLPRLREIIIALLLGIALGLLFAYLADPSLFERLFVRRAGTRVAESASTLPTATPTLAHSLTVAPGSTLSLTGTQAPISTPLPTGVPTTVQTPLPTQTPRITPTQTQTAALTQGSTQTPLQAPEGMALIPAGYFQMGSKALAIEAPEHPVLLDAFYLDSLEVTNAQYQQCVSADGCSPSGHRNSFTRAGYRDDPAYADYPVVGVTWDQAQAYCEWAGKRLPTEAEWEYAASGPGNFTWPWGNTFDPQRLAASVRDTQPVDSYPEGVSPFGVYNMAGNAAEWVADGYDPNFYANSPPRNPRAESEGASRIYRGGSFGNLDGSVYTTSHRYGLAHTFTDVAVGFRCAQDIPVLSDRTPSASLVSEFCQIFLAYKPGAACP